MKIKTKLVIPFLILMPLAACQSEQPSTSTAPVSHEAASSSLSTVAVTKEAVETHVKDLQANMAQHKEAATKAAKQLTETVKENAKAVNESATKAVIAAKEIASTKAAEVVKAIANIKTTETVKPVTATVSAETTKPVAMSKVVNAVKPATAIHNSAPVIPTALLANKPKMAAMGDATKGKSLANKCKGCHKFTAKKKVGPGLKGVVGRKSGAMAGMKYSDALAAGSWVWNERNLAIWVCDSKTAVKTLSGNASAKTKMGAQRICDATKQADLIAFLKTL